jgi:hypothetical protein
MTRKTLLFFLAFIFTLAFQVSAQRSEDTDTADDATESIVGKWQLEKVYAGSREITTNPNAESRSWIEFNEDGTYTSEGENNDRGSYRLNENHSVLYLESGEESNNGAALPTQKLREYAITITDSTLTMLPKSENSGSNKYVYQKNGAAEGK